MHFEILVEERSAAAALENLMPALRPDATYRIHPFQGKKDLLNKLPQRLQGYRAWLPEDGIIVVLVDRDQQDCRELKAAMRQLARAQGFATLGESREHPQVINRIAVEELEAWFFGDQEALLEVYPRLPKTLHQRKGYRDPDKIRGGTWEALERMLQRAGIILGAFQRLRSPGSCRRG